MSSAHARYIELEELGRGGMGRVTRAYDTKLQREVALKTLLRHSLSPMQTARLIIEARAMARLSHSNVVSIYDAYDDDHGRLVLAMELVRGQTLAQWLQSAQRAWPETIDALYRAGCGLAAAHAQGLLHRDFKPSNVLCTEEQGRLVSVKVTDFGLARWSEAQSLDQTWADHIPPEDPIVATTVDGLTETGVTVGTPAYMAPEQHASETLSKAADQYAFCLTLWEALTGNRPFEGGVYELHDRKLLGPPSWPQYLRVPRPLVSAIQRGLAPNPSDRFSSMNELLLVLSKEIARPRGRERMIALGGIAALGVFGSLAAVLSDSNQCDTPRAPLVAVWNETLREEARAAFFATNRPYAASAWERIEASLNTYADDLEQMSIDACEATIVHHTQSPAIMDRRMACLHRATVELGSVTQVLRTADKVVLDRSLPLLNTMTPLEQCADLDLLLAEVPPPPTAEADTIETAHQWLARSRAQGVAGHPTAALQTIQQAQEQLKSITYEPIKVDLSLAWGQTLERLGRFFEAESLYRDVLKRSVRAKMWPTAALVAKELSLVVGERQARYEEGLIYAELAQSLTPPQTSARRMSQIHASIAWMYSHLEQFETSLAHFHEGLRELESLDPPPLFGEAQLREGIAANLAYQGQYQLALAESRRVLELRIKAVGPIHPTVASDHLNLGSLMIWAEQFEEAEIELRHSIRLWIETLGPDHPSVGLAHHNLGSLLLLQHKYEAAEVELQEALRLKEPSLAPDHREITMIHHSLGIVYRAQGRIEQAETSLRLALDARQGAMEPDNSELARSRYQLGALLVDQGRIPEARPLLEKAWIVLSDPELAGREKEPAEQAHTAFALAQARWASGTSDEVASLLAIATQEFTDLGPEGSQPLQKIRQWQRGHRAALAGPTDTHNSASHDDQ